MKNGNEVLATIDATASFLRKLNVLDYYRQILPSADDNRFDEITSWFQSASAKQRTEFQQGLSQEQRAFFGIYGHRAATRAVREEAAALLLQGLAGAIIANFVVPDNRKVDVGLAIYHHCAQKLGLSPAELFSTAAAYAEPELADKLRNYGNRDDVTLDKFGWREIKTPMGVQYKFAWR